MEVSMNVFSLNPGAPGTHGEFQNRRKSRSNEAEVVFRTKIRLLTSAATILELALPGAQR
jgi:hypothetical protein